MSDSSVLRRRATHHTWTLLAFGLIIVATVLALVARPRSSTRNAIGSPGPAVRPQSDTRPMPPPSVARTRGLAA